jgi:hypothetical protein
MNIVISVILLGSAVGGFYWLDFSKAVLWLLFLIIAYPPALAFTKADPQPSADLLSLYRSGISQIPFVSQIISTLVSQRSVPLAKGSRTTKLPKSDVPEDEQRS